MYKLKLGADPEYFLKKGRSWRSAHGLIEGTKEKPVKVDKGAIQIDGTAVEFNIDPAESENEFTENIQAVLGQLREVIPEEYSFQFAPVANYNREYFKEEVPNEAKILGCEPDFNAYTGLKNVTPNVKANFRTAAGHLHFGWGEDIPVSDVNHFKDCRLMASYCDLFIGVPLGLLEPYNKRAELYGKAGAFRPKPYGFEYRTPSNHWLKTEQLQRLVYKQAQRCFKFVSEDMDILGRHFYTGEIQRIYDYQRGQERAKSLWNMVKQQEDLFEPELFTLCYEANLEKKTDVWQ